VAGGDILYIEEERLSKRGSRIIGRYRGSYPFCIVLANITIYVEYRVWKSTNPSFCNINKFKAISVLYNARNAMPTLFSLLLNSEP
jgi:hypothetical protein